MKRSVLLLFVFSFVLVINSTPAGAFWDEGGNIICDATSSQRYVQAVSDEAGNTFLVWEDYRNGTDPDIYFQKIDSNGNPFWAADGVAVVSGTGYQTDPMIFSDGEGGVVITWEDYQTGPIRSIKAQRFDADGNYLWTAGGETLVSGSAYLYNVKVITDESGGVIALWDNDSSGNYDVYVQRMDGDGNVVWGAGGIRVSIDTGSQFQAVLCPDGSGGAIVAWRDTRLGNDDVYARHVGANGTLYWNYNGIVVCNDSYGQYVASIVPDGSGGAIIAWKDMRNGIRNIYAQRVAAGNGSGQWTANGISICSASIGQDNTIGVSDGNGGAIFTWTDERNGNYDVYAQRVSNGGTMAWTIDGISICNQSSYEYTPQLILTETGNAVWGWRDNRFPVELIYAQMVDPSGVAQWVLNGIPVSSPDIDAEYLDISLDREGGVIIAWNTYASGVSDIKAQRVERNGYWGYPAAQIADVRDIPGDQGGSVDLAWYASRLDPWPEMGLSHYTVWRAIDHSEAMLASGDGMRIILSASEIPSLDELRSVEKLPLLKVGPTLEELTADPAKDIIRMETVAGSTYFWKLISTLDAYYLDSYSEVAATLFDSTSVSDEYHYFQVIAHTSTPSMFWVSEPDSGYSVDNLAPVVPLGFAGEQSYTPEGIQLIWNSNDESDLSGYRIYRGTTETFEPGAGNLLTSVPDTTTFDDTWSWEAGYYYKLSAVDIHGNESGYTLLAPAEITGDDPSPAPLAAYLAQNYPNPFNPSTTIKFGLKEAGHVSLRIYDAAGRLVRKVIDSELPKGHYTENWDGLAADGRRAASGIYFYHLRAGDFTGTRKMILLR